MIRLKRNLGHFICYFMRNHKSYNQFKEIRILEERWSDCDQPVQRWVLYDHEWFLSFPVAQKVGGSCVYVLHFLLSLLCYPLLVIYSLNLLLMTHSYLSLSPHH